MYGHSTVLEPPTSISPEPEHFTTYVEGIQQRGAAGVADYLERYVYAPGSHADYLALFGQDRLTRAVERGRMLTT